MAKAVIEIDGSQLLSALEKLPQGDLKKIIDAVFLRQLVRKPEVVKKHNIQPNVAEEAVRWARRSK
jgi:hypothetical protein